MQFSHQVLLEKAKTTPHFTQNHCRTGFTISSQELTLFISSEHMKKLGSQAAQEPMYRPVYLQSLFLLQTCLDEEEGQEIGTYSKTHTPKHSDETKRPKYTSRSNASADSSQRRWGSISSFEWRTPTGRWSSAERWSGAGIQVWELMGSELTWDGRAPCAACGVGSHPCATWAAVPFEWHVLDTSVGGSRR